MTDNFKLAPVSHFCGPPQYGLSIPAVPDGDVPIVGMKDLIGGRVDVSNVAKIKINGEAYQSYGLNAGDLLLNRTNSRELVGKLAIWDYDKSIEAVFASYLVRYPIRTEIADPRYVINALHLGRTRHQIERLITPGVSQANINASAFYEEVAIPLPPLAEQRRIADILDAWDRAIAQADALASRKRSYFDQLIQDLVGRHQRMHLARDDWTRSELSALVSFKSGGTPSKTEAAYWGGPVPWISAKDLKEFDVAASIQTLTAEGAARASIVPANTILLLVRGMGLFKDIPIGVTRRPVAFNQDIKALIPVEKIDSRFLAYALKSWRTVLMDRVDRAGHGTGRLAMDFIEALPIAFPSTAQQQRIVATLDTADSEIQTITSLASKLAIQRSAVASTLLNSAPRGSESEAVE